MMFLYLSIGYKVGFSIKYLDAKPLYVGHVLANRTYHCLVVLMKFLPCSIALPCFGDLSFSLEFPSVTDQLRQLQSTAIAARPGSAYRWPGEVQPFLEC